MGRMGIDYGRRRIGVALGAFIASEHDTIENNEGAIEKIVDIIKAESIDEVVIGRPLRSRGEQGGIAEEITRFRERLTLLAPTIVVHIVDEAFTSTQAEIELKERGLATEAIKTRIDQYAATLILDQYNQEHPGVL